MVNSVIDNKGFYISRYEISQKDNITAQSKRGQNPWVNISQLDAITASSNMNTSINSHLIYGIEWDSILTWLLDSSAKIGADTVGENLQTITLNDIQNDSRNFGNYLDSKGGAESNSSITQTTGKNEYWKVNNIYDLAGNVWEWTQEKFSINSYCTSRGGCYMSYGDEYMIAHRYGAPETSYYEHERISYRILFII